MFSFDPLFKKVITSCKKGIKGVSSFILRNNIHTTLYIFHPASPKSASMIIMFRSYVKVYYFVPHSFFL